MKSTRERPVVHMPKPYPEHKDSGVEWLGAVPAHWEVRHLGRVGRLFKGGGGTKEDERESGVPCVRYGDLYTQHTFFITASRACVAPEVAATVYTPLRFGDVLFAGSGETIDEIGKSAVNLIRGSACCGGDVIIFRSSIRADPRFLGYVSDCPSSARQKTCMGRGFTVVHIYSSDLKYMAIPLPPVPEQAAIVRFLDHVDRRIRRYIRAKEKLIALLEEQKQALIHEAVTGRIDVRTGRPYPAYKDSGVEWLAVVPEHWRLRRLKDVAAVQTGITLGKDYKGRLTISRPYLRVANVQDGHLRLIKVKSVDVPVSEAERATLVAGDVLMTEGGDIDKLGRGCVWRGEIGGCLHQNHVFAVRCKRPVVNPDFLVRLMESQHGRVYFELTAKRTTNLACTNGTTLRAFPVLLPEPEEQRGMLNAIARHTRALGEAMARTQREIDLMREYRTCLISDIVTGKLDVRETAARLAEVDPLGIEAEPDGVAGDVESERAGWRKVADVADPVPDAGHAEQF